MSPEERSEARRLADAATEGPWEFRATEHSGGIKFVVAPKAPRNENDTEFIPADCSHGYNGRFIAASRTLVPQLLDALEAAERERDEAQQIAAKQIDEWVKGASQKLIDQRDTARAQVETLAEALRPLARSCALAPMSIHNPSTCWGCISLAALKAAGVAP